ncbi:MAG: hypothetical protein RSA20_11335, partial [Oscillospiraceae bacterium]
TSENSDKIKKTTGKVARIAQEAVAGQSMYRIILENKTSMLFNVQSTVSEELAITQAGDEVSISYHEGAASISEVTEFDNLAFKQGE